MKPKRTAIVSDVMMRMGGAEKVVKSLLEIFPQADFYTLLITPGARKELEARYPGIKIKTSIFQLLVRGDQISKYISLIKIFSWIYWETLDLSKYDWVISSSHSFMAKNVKTNGRTKHLSYIHTPPRYLYQEFNELSFIKSFPFNFCLGPMMVFLRWIDKRGSKRPDILVANSKNVKARIEKYYGRKAVVVYPPAEIEKILAPKKKGNYFVCLSRLVKQKGIDLAVKVCTQKNWPLVVIGDGSERHNLEKLAGKSVKFVGAVDDEKKLKILAKAKALIYLSKDEDFGIVPVEAMMLGIPVVALNSGGVRESIINGKNGILFENNTAEELVGAIEKLETIKRGRDNSAKLGKQFSALNFKKEILGLLSK